jgi:serine phosphatase RsbU (regulator of sigma subunit)
VPATVNRFLAPLGAWATIFLADHEQVMLRPLKSGAQTGAGPQPIDGSLAGRAFQTVSILPASNVLWVPIVDGTVRLGVLAVTLTNAEIAVSSALQDGCRAVAGLVGHLLQAKSALGDQIELTRRSRPMSVASELLRTQVPPSTFACGQLTVSAVLEPSYDVGGDGYDYSINGNLAHLLILDALGHGLPAALTCSVALAATRAARRRQASLTELAWAADQAITDQWQDSRFATAVLAQLDLDTGVVSYVNAGHPPPVVLRSGRMIGLLDRGRRMPLGLGDESAQPAEQRLEPGDRLLFYTDGVTEARDAQGQLFGLDRLVQLAERHAASKLATAEILRRLSHAVLDHQKGKLQDDATLVLIEWWPETTARAVP